ncbi:MAG TPA: chromate efflux transporter [Candidatus Saccharimonadales bacterium]|nr:chromate efflux transporter [Candidatus Saccharimonadales bacterium]
MQDEGTRIAAPDAEGVFSYFFRLGFVNIGGPVAQLAMMYDHAVDRAHWITRERFVRIMGVCHILPGPEALQLAIYVGYLTRGIRGGVFAGVMFVLPGAVLITILAALYAAFGSVPSVNDALYVLKPAVLGIIAAGLLRIGRAALTSWTLALIAAAAFAGMRLLGVDVILTLFAAGVAALLVGPVKPETRPASVVVGPLLWLGSTPASPWLAPVAFTLAEWVDVAWVFLRTGLFSFGGAYGSLALLTRGVVTEHGWLTSAQLLDGVALSIATPGPFMLFATWAGYLIAGVPGAAAATVLVFLPSFILVLAAARRIEQMRERPAVRRFLAGVSAGVVAVILLVTLELAPAALVDPLAGVIALAAFSLIVIAKRDVALVSLLTMGAGIAHALLRLALGPA